MLSFLLVFFFNCSFAYQYLFKYPMVCLVDQPDDPALRRVYTVVSIL